MTHSYHIFTVNELAEEWRCSPSAVYDLLTSGKLKGFKLGHSWRITEEAKRTFEQTPAVPPTRPKQATKRLPAVTRIT